MTARRYIAMKGVLAALCLTCALAGTGCHSNASAQEAPRYRPQPSPADGLSREQAMQQMQQQMSHGMQTTPAASNAAPGAGNGTTGTP